LVEEFIRISEYHSAAQDCCEDMIRSAQAQDREALQEQLNNWASSLKGMLRPPLSVDPNLFGSVKLELVKN
jgi:hypothetical protein